MPWRRVGPGRWALFYGPKHIHPGARWVRKDGAWRAEYNNPHPVDNAALGVAIAALTGRDGPIPGFEYKIAVSVNVQPPWHAFVIDNLVRETIEHEVETNKEEFVELGLITPADVKDVMGISWKSYQKCFDYFARQPRGPESLTVCMMCTAIFWNENNADDLKRWLKNPHDWWSDVVEQPLLS